MSDKVEIAPSQRGGYKTVKFFDWVKAELDKYEEQPEAWSIRTPVGNMPQYSFDEFSNMQVEELEDCGFCELQEVAKNGYVYTKEVLEKINSSQGKISIMGISGQIYGADAICGSPNFYSLSFDKLLEEGFITKKIETAFFEGGTFDPKVVYASNDVKVVGPDGKKSYTIKTNLGVQTSYLYCSELH